MLRLLVTYSCRGDIQLIKIPDKAVYSWYLLNDEIRFVIFYNNMVARWFRKARWLCWLESLESDVIWIITHSS